MKTYGLKRREACGTDDWICGRSGTGRQSRKMARRRTKDKKILHRQGRRTHKIEDQNDHNLSSIKHVARLVRECFKPSSYHADPELT